MSGSDEPDESKRLSEMEAIAEALRAGTLDTTTRFGERRGERADGSENESTCRAPDDILRDIRSADDAESEDTTDREDVVAELTVQIARDELGSDVLRDRLKEALTPDVPSDSVRVREIKNVTPTLNTLQVQMVVALDVKIVEEMLSRDLSKTSADTQVTLLT